MQKNNEGTKTGAASKVSQIPRARKNRGNSLPRDSASYRLASSRSPEAKKATGDRHSTASSIPPPSIKSHCSVTLCMPPDNARFVQSKDMKEGKSDLPPTVVTKVTRQLCTKKREFMKMKKNLTVQQNALLAFYASLKELEGRGGDGSGGTGSSLDETVGTIRIISMSGWPAHDLMLIIRDDLAKPLNFDVDSIIAPQVFEQLVAQLSVIPDEVAGLGEELITAGPERNGSQRSLKQRTEWKNKCSEAELVEERLHAKVQAVVQNLHARILNALELAKTAWIDRDTLVKKIEKLQKDNMTLHHKLDEEVKEKDDRIHNDPKPPGQEVAEVELQKERAAREALNEVVSTAEGMLRVARARITTLERQLNDMKGLLEASNRKQKDLELLYRHRESSYDARSKKLIEVSKTGEITIDTLSRQREALEQRVKELQEKLRQKEQDSDAQIAELLTKINSLQGKMSIQKKGKEVTEGMVANLEAHVKELETQLTMVRQRSEKLIAFEQFHCLDFVPSKEAEPKERETQLWRELQATRASLAKTEEELRKSKLDKEEFLASLSRIAQCGDDASLHDKMATKLIECERKITKLQDTIKGLEETIKNMELTKLQHENKISEMRAEITRLRNYDNYGNDIPCQDLQSELQDLQSKVHSLTAERNCLAATAESRALLLERHERSADLFARITRARRDLAAYIEGRPDPPQQDEVARAEVHRSLTSFCASAADDWSALRTERERILVLERAVVSQNQQLDREAYARTQLQRRRAALEREILRSHYNQPTSSTSLNNFCDSTLIMPPVKNYYLLNP